MPVFLLRISPGMLKAGEASELIDLNDESLDTLTPLNSTKSDEIDQIKGASNTETKQPEHSNLLNEEIDTRNLPASPPFTKVSSIKMYKSPIKTSTSTSVAVNKQVKSTPLSKSNWKDPTKSFLPRIIKKRHNKP